MPSNVFLKSIKITKHFITAILANKRPHDSVQLVVYVACSFRIRRIRWPVEPGCLDGAGAGADGHK